MEVLMGALLMLLVIALLALLYTIRADIGGGILKLKSAWGRNEKNLQEELNRAKNAEKAATSEAEKAARAIKTRHHAELTFDRIIRDVMPMVRKQAGLHPKKANAPDREINRDGVLSTITQSVGDMKVALVVEGADDIGPVIEFSRAGLERHMIPLGREAGHRLSFADFEALVAYQKTAAPAQRKDIDTTEASGDESGRESLQTAGKASVSLFLRNIGPPPGRSAHLGPDQEDS